MKPFLFVSLCLFIFFCPLSANDFTKAGISFARGDFKAAEQLLSGYLSQNPGDEKAKNLYQRVAVRLSKEALDDGDDAAAREYAEKAYKLNPDDETTADLYKATRKIDKVRVERQEIKKQELALKKPSFKAFPEAPAAPPKIEYRTRTEYETRTEYKTKEIVRQVARIPEWIWLSIAFNAFLIFGVYLVYSYKKESGKEVYANYVRAKMMLANALKYDPEIVKKQLGAERAAELFKLISPENMPEDISIKLVESGRAFTDINPVPRLTADVIELAEVFLEKPKDIVEFIRPYLDHKDNRVRGNAVKTMFKHDSKLALKVLKEMASSEDRWQKISAVWVCGQLKTRDAQNMLSVLASDGDAGVALAAAKQLKEEGEIK
ncbi:MAG: hypothetical protein COS41_03980 [Elusimicrobia bacterium CG03_land_8_20_14_0_80_50_18]|nr:MAG: hypothetical protein COS41_03980 [Elusimicrobia bacterium CG03_land_8_20_14_0_80_50_18]PIX15479.1 MAG: hypothetical protein COZ72_03330 [Elusimicrobia bacterium CG_4_8_14_3_um_filter_50_9]